MMTKVERNGEEDIRVVSPSIRFDQECLFNGLIADGGLLSETEVDQFIFPAWRGSRRPARGPGIVTSH